jgi:hypothetical protein
MRRYSRYSRWVLWSLALAVFTVRASDTHLHLCFDGREAPAAVHLADGSVHNDEHHQEGEHHADKDVDPFVGLLLKSVGTDPDVALPTTIVALVLLLPPAPDAMPVATDPVRLAAGPPFHLRPPLRGPPA